MILDVSAQSGAWREKNLQTMLALESKYEKCYCEQSTSSLQAQNGNEELSSAVLRNVYGDKPEKRKHAELLARYMIRFSSMGADLISFIESQLQQSLIRLIFAESSLA